MGRVTGSAGRRRRRALPVAIAVAFLVAEGAVWLLRPDDILDPVDVPETRYFEADELQEVRDYASGQRALALAALGVQLGLLGLLIARPPRRTVRLVERVARGRPLVAGAIAGAALVVALRLTALPMRALARERAIDVGLATQTWTGWAEDAAKATAIAAILAGLGATFFLALMRRFPRRWWLGGAAAAVTAAIVFTWLAPVVLAPLFNRFEKLPQGRTRADLIELARDAGVDVGDVLVVDASRRTRAANAYVTGIGGTKRIVLYDTLLDRFTADQAKLVVAHELAHVKHRDVQRGILWTALVAPAGMYLVMILTGRWSERADARPGSVASLPAFALALSLVVFGATVVANQLSRRVEARADEFSLELTKEPDAFIAMQQRLTLANKSDPNPAPAIRLLFGTHPPSIERIGQALAFAQRREEFKRPLASRRPTASPRGR